MLQRQEAARLPQTAGVGRRFLKKVKTELTTAFDFEFEVNDFETPLFFDRRVLTFAKWWGEGGEAPYIAPAHSTRAHAALKSAGRESPVRAHTELLGAEKPKPTFEVVTVE